MTDQRWRPIASAPKDGREILVHDEGAVVVAWWSVRDAAWYDHGTMYPAPQHWRPMPAPPNPRMQQRHLQRRQQWAARGLCWICHQPQTEVGLRGTVKQAHGQCRRWLDRGRTEADVRELVRRTVAA